MARERKYDYRRHVRMRTFDYRCSFAYFVTICVGHRSCVFGFIEGGTVALTRRGVIACECWDDIPNHHAHVELEAIIVMPNHIHGVLRFEGDEPGMTGPSAAATVEATPASRSPRSGEVRGPTAGSLSAVIGSYKSAVTRTINRLRPGAGRGVWQANFYEHIIRNDRAIDAIRDYIMANPLRWPHDVENPEGDGTDDFMMFMQRLSRSDDLPLRGNRDAGVATTKDRDAGVAITEESDVRR